MRTVPYVQRIWIFPTPLWFFAKPQLPIFHGAGFYPAEAPVKAGSAYSFFRPLHSQASVTPRSIKPDSIPRMRVRPKFFDGVEGGIGTYRCSEKDEKNRGYALRNPLKYLGTEGETRTLKGLPPADFESAAFTIPPPRRPLISCHKAGRASRRTGNVFLARIPPVCPWKRTNATIRFDSRQAFGWRRRRRAPGPRRSRDGQPG